MNQTRRDFLRFAAMISGAAGIAGFVPESIQRAMAIDPAPGSTYRDAEHIVILMQENRSFDHALGTLRGVRGFNDPRALRLPNGHSVFTQTDAAGNTFAPWRLDIKDTKITWMGSIPHTRNSQVDAWNAGHHDGWIDAKRSGNPDYRQIPITMGHYTREDLPFYYALADAFTVCDQSYCGVMTSTTPNRCTFWTGTCRDQQIPSSRVFMRNNEIDIGGMTWKTYPERLTENGIKWKFYQNELTTCGGMTADQHAWLSNFGCNILEFFAAFNIEAYPGAVLRGQQQLDALKKQIAKAESQLSEINDPDQITDLRTRMEIAQKHIDTINARLASSGEARYKKMSAQERTLHDSAFITNANDPHYHALEPLAFDDNGTPQHIMVPKGDILHQFRKDVDEGKLPTVSWLSAPERFSDHPTSPWYGAWYVSEVLNILTKNPEVWKKTIFIVTYDENDGYFDHSPSYVAADPKRPETGGASAGIDTALEYTSAQDEIDQGVPQKEARSGPIGLGYRIPTYVASPWSRGGWVNSQLFDHTSTLMFLEDFLQQKYGRNVREEQISAWRRAISGDLTSCFRPHEAGEPKIDYVNRDKFVVSIAQAKNKEVPSNFRKLSPAECAAIAEAQGKGKGAAQQEPGVKPSCALPYELYAHARLSEDGSHVELELKAGNQVHGARSSGAPFNVYLRNLAGDAHGMRAATYAVKPGDTLRPTVPVKLFAGGHYVIEVIAPNGFFRSFAGGERGVETEVSYDANGAKLSGNVQCWLRNRSAHAASVTVRDNSYKGAAVERKIAAGERVAVPLSLTASHGWYDFTVLTAGSKSEARFAGRVETGQSSFTDPLMGGAV